MQGSVLAQCSVCGGDGGSVSLMVAVDSFSSSLLCVCLSVVV